MNAFARPAPANLPHSLEIEQAVLGALLLNNDALASVTFLSPSHFFEPLHGAIFGHIVELAKAGKATPATVRQYLPADLKIGDMNAGQYLARLAAEAVSVSGAAGYGRVVFDHAIRRELVTIGEDVSASARAMAIDLPPAEQIADAEARLFELAAAIRHQQAEASETIGTVITSIEEAVAAGRGTSGVECGIRGIDEKLGGFSPGALVILAGRPGMGKTALGLSLARRAAHIGVGVAFDSIEMPSKQLTIRLLADECEAMGHRIPYTNMVRGRLNAAQLDTVKRAAENVRRLPLILNDKGNRLADIPGHIRSARRELEKFGKGLDLFMVDYLGLIRPSDRYSGNKVHETGEISAALKEMAKREKIPIIALHQLNRALERQDEKRPGLADLRDSGNIEQDADVVAFVYREHYYLSKPGARIPRADDGDNRSEEARRMDMMDALENDMEVIIGKNRQGPVGIVRLWCNMATNSVRDAA